MSDPTPEERAVRLIERMAFDSDGDWRGLRAEIAALARAAVAAETERCVVAIFNDHQIPGEFQIRARDAIRRGGE